MRETVTYKGFCPYLQKEHSIDVDYIFDNQHIENAKGHFDCDYAYICNYAKLHECPINTQSPKHI